MLRQLTILTCSALLSAACKTGDQAARIIDADDASRASLQSTVNAIIGSEVTLADSALTEHSVLVIENWPRGTMQNPVPQGRVMEPPVRLLLVINRGQCLLVDGRDGSRHPLSGVRCAPE